MENFDCFPNIHQRSLERNIGLWTVIWKQHYYSTWLQSTISVISFQIVGFLCPRIKANVNYVIFEDKTFNTYNKINMLACSILKKKKLVEDTLTILYIDSIVLQINIIILKDYITKSHINIFSRMMMIKMAHADVISHRFKYKGRLRFNHWCSFKKKI